MTTTGMWMQGTTSTWALTIRRNHLSLNPSLSSPHARALPQEWTTSAAGVLLHNVGVAGVPKSLRKLARLGGEYLEFSTSVVRNFKLTVLAAIRITMAASVGLPSSSFCINRCLYNIANIRTISVSKAEKRRSVVIDSLICGLFLSYIPHYNTSFMATATIFSRTLGAIPTSTTPSPPTSSRASGPSSLGLSLLFTASSLRCFTRCRTEFAQFLSSNTPITASRYFRLMALATTELCCTMPLALFTIYLNAVVRTAPFCALVFFAFFGFAVEARKNYRTAFWALWDPEWARMRRAGGVADGVAVGEAGRGRSRGGPLHSLGGHRGRGRRGAVAPGEAWGRREDSVIGLHFAFSVDLHRIFSERHPPCTTSESHTSTFIWTSTSRVMASVISK
ncbi:pheromone A receptor-domain-containing protein [Mycena rebaudengoi]|nr:pheromone A receptor-domain-containing protein [Mycena rebaudengoi]